MSSTKVTIPVVNKRVRVSVFASSSAQQDVIIRAPGVSPVVVSSPIRDGHVMTQDITPTKPGDWEISIEANGKESEQVSARVELANSLNVIIIGSEDGTDRDFNDTVCIIQWPVG